MNQVLDPCAPQAGFASEPIVTRVAKAKNPTAEEYFSEAQWRELRGQDKLAGTAVVAVMTAIFSLGLLGYIVIALLCAGG